MMMVDILFINYCVFIEIVSVLFSIVFIYVRGQLLRRLINIQLEVYGK